MSKDGMDMVVNFSLLVFGAVAQVIVCWVG